MSKLSHRHYISPLFATLHIFGSVALLLMTNEWTEVWLVSAVQIVLLFTLTRNLSSIKYSFLASLSFTGPLLIVHGILNPQFSSSFTIFNIIPVRNDGLVFGGLIGGRLSIISNIGIMITFVPLREAMRYLLRLKFPKSIVFSLAMSFSLLKEIQRRAVLIYVAQRSRGIPVSGGIIQRVKSLPSMVLPLIISTILESQQRALCLKSRGIEYMSFDNYELANHNPDLAVDSINIHAKKNITFTQGDYLNWLAPVGFGKSKLAQDIALGDSSKLRVFHFTRNGQVADEKTLIKEIAWIPTDCRHVLSGLTETVEEELLLTATSRLKGENSRGTLDELFETFSLQNLRYQHPFTLSGGETLRLVLAITFTKLLRFLVLDQSLEFLDADQRKSFLKFLVNSNKSRKLAICHFKNRSDEDDTYGRIESFMPVRDYSGPTTTTISKIGSPPNETALIADNLSYTYKQGFSLKHVTLSAKVGEIVFLSGPNGSGKTTLLKCLACLLESSGKIQVLDPKNNCLTSPPIKKHKHEWARFVGYLFQNPTDQIFRENVFEEVAHTAKTYEDAASALSVLGLISIREHNPLEIPLPLQRIVTLATTLAMRSPVILLDEPTAFLDEKLSSFVVSAIKQYKDAGHTFIIVSHDVLLKEKLKSRTFGVHDGSVSAFKEDK